MKILSGGENVSSSFVIRIVASSINKFLSMIDHDAKIGIDSESSQNVKEDPTSAVKKEEEYVEGHLLSGNEQKLTESDKWKLRMNKLNNFSVPSLDSNDIFENHIEFLESVKKYASNTL